MGHALGVVPAGGWSGRARNDSLQRPSEARVHSSPPRSPTPKKKETFPCPSYPR